MRELQAELEKQGIDVLLVNIHDSTGQVLIARYDFEVSPTYLVFDRDGWETWRGHTLPSRQRIAALAGLE